MASVNPSFDLNPTTNFGPHSNADSSPDSVQNSNRIKLLATDRKTDAAKTNAQNRRNEIMVGILASLIMICCIASLIILLCWGGYIAFSEVGNWSFSDVANQVAGFRR